MSAPLTRLRRSESGAAAVEFALVGLVAITLILAILEFGRGLYMRNELASAADAAVRKMLTDRAATNSTVEATVRDAFAFGTSEEFEVVLGSETIEGIAFKTLLIRYPLTLFIPSVSTEGIMLTVSRRIPVG